MTTRASGCSGSVVTWRRAQMVLLSTQGMDVPAIAKVAFTSEDRVRDVIRNFNADGVRRQPGRRGGEHRRDEARIAPGRLPRHRVSPRVQAEGTPGAAPRRHGGADLPVSTLVRVGSTRRCPPQQPPSSSGKVRGAACGASSLAVAADILAGSITYAAMPSSVVVLGASEHASIRAGGRRTAGAWRWPSGGPPGT